MTEANLNTTGPQELTQSPIILAVTAVSGLLAAVNGFTSLLQGAPPFWSDSISALFVGSVALLWVVHTLRLVISNRAVRGRSSTLRDTLKGLAVPAATCTLLAALFVWNSWLPINHCLNRSWTVCGTFVSKCGKRSCLWLYDERSRPIQDHCQALSDDSSFVLIHPPHWWTYLPRTAALVCDQQKSEVFELGKAFASPSCDAVKEF